MFCESHFSEELHIMSLHPIALILNIQCNCSWKLIQIVQKNADSAYRISKSVYWSQSNYICTNLYKTKNNEKNRTSYELGPSMNKIETDKNKNVGK